MTATLRGYALATYIVVSAICARVAAAPAPIQEGSDLLSVTHNVPPFSVSRCRVVEASRSGLAERFGPLPGNGSSGCHYRDPSRHMLVRVSVIREVRVEYLDHMVEGYARDHKTGTFNEPVDSLITLNGNAILQVCLPAPDCKERYYHWRSNSDIVSVAASALSDDAEGRQIQLNCPEPTEVLLAYLQRYPSTLTQNWAEPTLKWANSKPRAREYLRTYVSIELASARFWINVLETKPMDAVLPADLRKIESRLRLFAKYREKNLGGPSAEKEASRIKALQSLEALDRFRGLKAIADEYSAWWADNVGTPVIVPAIPPAIPAPSPAPAS